jgi:hydroxylamine reductase
MFYHQLKEMNVEGDAGQNGPRPWHPSVAALQGILTHCLAGLCQVVTTGLESGLENEVETGRTGIFTAKALAAIHGEAAADPHRLIELIQQAVVLRDQIKERIRAQDPKALFPPGPADFEPATSLEGLLSQAGKTRPDDIPAGNQDILTLKQILMSGLCGVASYAAHAHLLGGQDARVSACIFDNLAAIYSSRLDAEALTDRIRACGDVAYIAMGLLDRARARAYGEPLPAAVSLGCRKGRAILVSGQDFQDLEALLRQTDNSGIRVYTHGEMLDAHQYPQLKQFAQFSGHYEGKGQHEDGILRFPGPVVLTAGSSVPFRIDRGQNLFTSGPMNHPGIPHITRRDFKPVIDQALAMEGFIREESRGSSLVGNRQEEITAATDRISRWIKQGKTSGIFFAADCHGPGQYGREPTVTRSPADRATIFLTCNAGATAPHTQTEKAGPLCLGHCHDPQVIIRIVEAFSASLETRVDALPLSLDLSWYGQKSVGVVLALISLGLKDIRLGPILPAGITPVQAGVLESRFGIRSQGFPGLGDFRPWSGAASCRPSGERDG